MDKYIWISPDDDFTIDGYDKILIGDESCGKYLASSNFFKQVTCLVESGLDVTIVTPYLTPDTEKNFQNLLLNTPNEVNIIVNDVGAFQIVRKSSHIPIIGRLLMRQNTDPAIMAYYQRQSDVVVRERAGLALLEHMMPPETLTKHFSDSPIFSKETSNLFLSGYDRMTVMMDWLPHGLPQIIPDRFDVILNTENIIVSVLPCISCDHCPKNEVLLGTTRANVPIYRKRNICYYRMSDVQKKPLFTIPDYVKGLIF